MEQSSDESQDVVQENFIRQPILERRREWSVMRDEAKIDQLFNEKIARQPLFLKHTVPEAEFAPAGRTEDGYLYYCSPALVIPDKITLYRTFKAQLEVDFLVAGRPEPGQLILQPQMVRLARQSRSAVRFSVKEEVYANSFQLMRTGDLFDKTRKSMFHRVIFADSIKKHAFKFPQLQYFDIHDFNRPDLVKLLEKEAPLKGIYLPDCRNLEDYSRSSAGFVSLVDLTAERGDTAGTLEGQMRRDKCSSLLVLPITIEKPGGAGRAAMAYLYLPQQQGGISEADIDSFRAEIDTMVDKILRASMVEIKEHQRILDISQTGMALELTNDQLKEYLPKSSEVTLDLVQPRQVPLRLLATITHIFRAQDRLVAGLHFDGTGHSMFKASTKERLETIIRRISTSEST